DIFHLVTRTSSSCVTKGCSREAIARAKSLWYQRSSSGSDATPCASITAWYSFTTRRHSFVSLEFHNPAIRSPRFRLIAHVIRQRMQLLLEHHSHVALQIVLVQRAIHAPEPLVALPLADGERKVTHAKSRVAILLHVQLRPASPAAHEHVQLPAG